MRSHYCCGMLTDRSGAAIGGRLERALRGVRVESGATPARTAQAVLAALLGALNADGGALVLMDPRTSLFTSGAVTALPPASCHPFFRFEVDSEATRTFRRLAASGAGAVTVNLHESDDGYREAVLYPYGYNDELRVVCRAAGTSWAGVSLWRRIGAESFTIDEERALDRVAPTVGSMMRDAVVRSIGVAPDTGTRHVLVLDGDDVVESSTRSADDLEQLRDPDFEEYRHLDHLRALARSSATFSTVIGMDDGRWLAAHGTPFGSGRVAIILTSATPSEMFGVVVAGAGLTHREIEVTRLICRGHSDSEIGVLLAISPHTVHDHVRAVRTKLGVRSRTEVAAKVFDERYFEHFLASAAMSHL